MRSRLVITQLEASLSIVLSKGPVQGEQITVRGVDEVAAFVARLGEAGVDNAYTTHSGRPAYALVGDDDPTPAPDHVATLAVRDGFGYFHYIGNIGPDGDQRTFNGYALGDPGSPGTWVDGANWFPPGSGVPLPLFELVLAEFLTTGELPDRVRWISEDTP
jgi:hypothetical protein